MTLPTATELLHDWDAARPRSQQAEMGMSGLGDCRRRAGYRLQGFAPDPGADGISMPAILGTSVHETIAEATRQSVKVPVNAKAESLEVRFAGLVGHPDLYVEPILRDYKTVGLSAQLERIRAGGVPRTSDLWQASCYAAALILAGYRVTTLQVNYITRDFGAEWLWEGPFDMRPVRDAIAWLMLVRQTPAGRLPRDYRPESTVCQGCEFFARCWQGNAVKGRALRSALFVDAPDAAAWARRLELARAAKAAAESEEGDARGALDALRTVDRPGDREDLAIPGYAKLVRFAVARGAERLDRDQIEEDYKRAGARPPVVRGAPKISVSLVDPPGE